jgi:hypothetical protein
MVALSKGPCFTFGAKALGGVHSEERAALLKKLIFYLSDFFIYNNYNNHIINNNSDKRKILNLRMTACHCQWRGATRHY